MSPTTVATFAEDSSNPSDLCAVHSKDIHAEAVVHQKAVLTTDRSLMRTPSVASPLLLQFLR